MGPTAELRREAPSSADEAGEVLRAAGREGRSVRIRGGGTKPWGRSAAVAGSPPIELSTAGLDRIVEHNRGDMTAVIEAGAPLARVRDELGEAGQMVALDPPLGDGDAATIGGIVATGDSGPLRHRYGSPRDLVLGITVALSDGTVARAGGKVIKNVAGYDLPKLFTGSFGTLGLIVQVVMRLHPCPDRTVTAVGLSDDPAALGAATAAISHSPFGPECLDVSWADGHGEVMARSAGAAPEAGAEAVMSLMQEAGLDTALAAEDDDRWDRQRARQRSAHGVVLRVSGLPSELPAVLETARDTGASLVGRAGMGISWMILGNGEVSELVSAIEEVRRRLHPFACVVLDAPAELKETVEVWGEDDDGAVSLMRRVKARFDPHGVCNPGIFVGGI